MMKPLITCSLALLSYTNVVAQPPGVVPPDSTPPAEIPPWVQEEIDRCGLVVDAHLHEAMWFTTADPLLGEMSAAGIHQGVILAVYGPYNPFGTDPNQVIESLLGDRLFGLASLNTTVDWETQGATELERLATFLAKPGFVGTKIAPPHTCLPMNSTIMDQVLSVVDASPIPVIGIHIGTTPFCGPFGVQILGKAGCCQEEYVDPLYMEPLLEKYPDVTFVLMHSGQDFGNDGTYPYYEGVNFDHSLELAEKYPNVYLEISANLARNETTWEYRNPMAFENLVKIVDQNLQDRVIYGSDANQFPGRLLPYLNDTVVSLVEAGFTEEERCKILVENPRAAYVLPEATAVPENTTKAPSPGDTTTAPDPTEAPGDATEAPDPTPSPASAGGASMVAGYGMSLALFGLLTTLLSS